jgi:hypothetical protein
VEIQPYVSDCGLKSIQRALLKIGFHAHRQAWVYVSRIVGHARSSLVSQPGDGVPPPEPRDPRELAVLRQVDWPRAQRLAERLARRFDVGPYDATSVAVACVLISIEHQSLGRAGKKKSMFKLKSLIEDLGRCFHMGVPPKPTLAISRDILAWVEATWKEYCVALGWTLDACSLLKGDKSAARSERRWERNVAVWAVRHVDLLPFEDEASSSHLPSPPRARLSDYVYPTPASHQAKRKEEQKRKLDIASGRVQPADDERHLLHDDDVVRYRAQLLAGRSPHDLLFDEPSSGDEDGRPSWKAPGALERYAKKRGMSVSELIASSEDIPDHVLFGDELAGMFNVAGPKEQGDGREKRAANDENRGEEDSVGGGKRRRVGSP